MSDITAGVERCREAHERLRGTVETLDDSVMARASLLPGWSVGHVLTHIARNADSVTRRLEGALCHEVVSQYGSGVASREGEIERGARRPAGAIVEDLLQANARVERAFDSMDAGSWQNLIVTGSGGSAPAQTLLFSRWREVETHHVDLGLGYSTSDWPEALVDEWLPRLVDGLTGRADNRELMAWLLGRGPAPELPPWG